LSRKQRDSVNHVIVSIEQSHYRRNQPKFQSLDVVPAMRQPACDFFAASSWFAGSFLGRREYLCRIAAALLPSGRRKSGAAVMKRLPESS
jgi:hypothetical protein